MPSYGADWVEVARFWPHRLRRSVTSSGPSGAKESVPSVAEAQAKGLDAQVEGVAGWVALGPGP
jgi:hypothetical protein